MICSVVLLSLYLQCFPVEFHPVLTTNPYSVLCIFRSADSLSVPRVHDVRSEDVLRGGTQVRQRVGVRARAELHAGRPGEEVGGGGEPPGLSEGLPQRDRVRLQVSQVLQIHTGLLGNSLCYNSPRSHI